MASNHSKALAAKANALNRVKAGKMSFDQMHQIHAQSNQTLGRPVQASTPNPRPSGFVKGTKGSLPPGLAMYMATKRAGKK